ncbi:MAG: alpha/beta hydrolase [Deltaproteobacteria bacterium]|nr:alpha/beta hydrolase [Deltaproteobacteria bacterium]
MFDLPDPVPRVPWHHSTVTTDDGAALAVQSAGDGPAVLLANGIGVTAPGLDAIAEHLRHRGHRAVCWDYRGMGRSRVPSWSVEFTMPRHARDALQVLDALGEPKAAVLGWSMGVPVGLEMIRLAADRVTAFGVLFGSPGQPFRAAFPRPVSDLVHLAISASRVVPWGAQAFLRIGVTMPPLAWLLCTLIGFCGDRANRDVFMEHVRSVTESDKKAYFGTMYEMMHHDARDLLPSLRCPVLVVAGEKDWVTPPEAAAEMARLIPGARHVYFPETSHFGVIEHGPSLWDPIDQLLEDAGWAPPAARDAA